MPCLPLALSFHPRRLPLLNLVPENYASDTKGSLMRGQTSNFSGCVLLRVVFHWSDYVWRIFLWVHIVVGSRRPPT